MIRFLSSWPHAALGNRGFRGVVKAKIKLTKTAVELAQSQTKTIELRDTVMSSFPCKILLQAVLYRMIAGERRKLASGLLGELIEYSEIFRGTIDGASAYPREPIWETLWFNSAAVIVAGSSAMSFAECGLI
ncbi:hypothetical protein [Thauera sp. Sel9]|uniref:hypothetical protein n=1 Tax=Thauera sp. Sel9 TaxID=2974299 RepID=UPI0021E110C2|nr:hypothetical protein [Thauera sp. Sel9]MCV2217024.1 hypothetical protein [Thauera sp. Sel9]